MRGGKLLAEAAPEVVMRRYGCETLEEAFLLLSIKQSKTDGGTEEPVVVESTGKSTRIYIHKFHTLFWRSCYGTRLRNLPFVGRMR